MQVYETETLTSKCFQTSLWNVWLLLPGISSLQEIQFERK